ncbi:hypothetical protein [Staphylococcus epidermidis]|uniref:hypothetical protein n=1 Tax=Staphylococcus epidermidis TaxID=1282 RepID=UPI00187A16C3|nr:hypothetical protein [Staphylococcus epidermidis]
MKNNAKNPIINGKVIQAKKVPKTISKIILFSLIDSLDISFHTSYLFNANKILRKKRINKKLEKL